MPVFAVPEAIQTEEGKCSEVLKDTDRALEGKCTKEEGPFSRKQNLWSLLSPPQKCLHALPAVARRKLLFDCRTCVAMDSVALNNILVDVGYFYHET